MKNIILSVTMIILFSGLSIVMQYYPFDNTGVYDDIFKLREIINEPKTANEAIKEIQPLLNTAIRGASLEKFLEIRDSIYTGQLVTIEDAENDTNTLIKVHSFVFQFDENDLLDSIWASGFNYSSWLDTTSINYSPILSTLFQTSSYPFGWGPSHLIWMLFLVLISIIIILKLIGYVRRKNNSKLIEVMVLSASVLLINLVHLIMEFNFQINSNLLATRELEMFPTEVRLIKTMGIMSHYNAKILDVSIVFGVFLFGIMVLYYKRETSKEV